MTKGLLSALRGDNTRGGDRFIPLNEEAEICLAVGRFDKNFSPPTVKEYFLILEDTLIGRTVSSFKKRPKRRTIETPKFYLFDVGIVNYLAHRGKIEPKSELFGKAFEHFIFMELTAHRAYSGIHYSLSFWKTTSGFEVDFILGDAEIAIEVKSTDFVQNHHLKGLRAFKEEYKVKKEIVVSLDPKPRKTSGEIYILPWREFLDQLWDNQIMKSSCDL